MRKDLPTLDWFFSHFSTYYGDLWYCWNNYLHNNFPYPREYPSGIQIIFKLIFLLPRVIYDYGFYFKLICGILACVAIIISCLLYRLSFNLRKIIIFWLCAPSFLFYGLLNLDFLAIFTIVCSYYCFIRKMPILTGVFLALGTSIKVFPLFLFPVLFFSCSRRDKTKITLSLILAWLFFNLPAMFNDWNGWLFPLIWQIQENYARSMHDGSWTWLIYQIFDYLKLGSWSGKVSLGIFIFSYYYFLRKYWHLPLVNKLLMVLLLFILTDRVYSPQYNLYLLPLLVLVHFRVSLIYFYLLELSNLIQGVFLFFIKEHPYLLQSILLLKYIALIALFRQCLRDK